MGRLVGCVADLHGHVDDADGRCDGLLQPEDLEVDHLGGQGHDPVYRSTITHVAGNLPTSGATLAVRVDGKLIETIVTTAADAEGLANWPLARRVTGLAPGPHVLTVTSVSSGTFLWGDWGYEAPNYPAIIVMTGLATPTVPASSFTAVNAIIASVAAEYTDGQVHVADATSIWNPSTMIAVDRIHPNDLGNATIAGVIQPIITGPVQADYLTGKNRLWPTPRSTPFDIPGLVSWWSASSLANHADGDALSAWPDSGPSANNLAQATGADQPLYKVGIINGLPVVRFDRTASWMQATFALVQPQHVFMVLQIRTTATAGNPIDGKAQFAMALQRQTLTTMGIYAGTGFVTA